MFRGWRDGSVIAGLAEDTTFNAWLGELVPTQKKNKTKIHYHCVLSMALRGLLWIVNRKKWDLKENIPLRIGLFCHMKRPVCWDRNNIQFLCIVPSPLTDVRYDDRLVTLACFRSAVRAFCGCSNDTLLLSVHISSILFSTVLPDLLDHLCFLRDSVACWHP